jgi:hypothetical protein
LTLSSSSGTISKWQLSTDGGVVWSDVTNTTTTLTYTTIFATRRYRVVVTNGSCGTTLSSEGIITIAAPAVAGTATGGASHCTSTNSTNLSIGSSTGSLQWQSSTDNSTFNDISGQTSSSYTATNLSVTTYFRVLVTNGVCTTTSNTVTVTVNGISSVVATAISQTNVSCYGGTNGAATVSASGGTSPYTYSWSPSAGTNFTATGLSAATYTVTVTSANLCTATQTFSITQPSLVSAPTGNSTKNIIPSCNLTVANLAATGSNIQWYGSSSGSTALSSSTVLNDGTHYYASQTVSGCESPSRLNVTAYLTTIYTFEGTGDWTDEGYWSPCYPGLTIPSGYTALVTPGSTLTIPANTPIVNNGTISNNGTFVDASSGSYTNNGTYKGSGTFSGTVFINPVGGLVTPGD